MAINGACPVTLVATPWRKTSTGCLDVNERQAEPLGSRKRAGQRGSRRNPRCEAASSGRNGWMAVMAGPPACPPTNDRARCQRDRRRPRRPRSAPAARRHRARRYDVAGRRRDAATSPTSAPPRRSPASSTAASSSATRRRACASTTAHSGGCTRRPRAAAERRARRRATEAAQGARRLRPRRADHVDADGARGKREILFDWLAGTFEVGRRYIGGRGQRRPRRSRRGPCVAAPGARRRAAIARSLTTGTVWRER